jgi:hypothetical protein
MTYPIGIDWKTLSIRRWNVPPPLPLSIRMPQRSILSESASEDKRWNDRRSEDKASDDNVQTIGVQAIQIQIICRDPQKVYNHAPRRSTTWNEYSPLNQKQLSNIPRRSFLSQPQLKSASLLISLDNNLQKSEMVWWPSWLTPYFRSVWNDSIQNNHC